jgi:hypothetical protein
MGMKMQDSTTLNQATWNQNTAAGGSGTGATVSGYAWGYQSALITYQNTGTVSAGTVTWEGWDGYNWYVMPTALGTTAATIATTYTLTTGSAYFYANIDGFSQFRTRLSVAITGSGSVLVNINLSAASAQNIG